MTKQRYYPARDRLSRTTLAFGSQSISKQRFNRQVLFITNVLSVTIVEMMDGLLSLTVVHKLFPHE